MFDKPYAHVVSVHILCPVNPPNSNHFMITLLCTAYNMYIWVNYIRYNV